MAANKTLMLFFMITIILLLAGCGVAETPVPTQTNTSIPPTPTPLVIEVTFDGIECTNSGPNEIPTGKYLFILNDLSDKNLEVYVVRLLDGKTVQDLFDRQSESGEYVPKPEWSVHPPKSYLKDEKVWVHSLDEPGYYTTDVGRSGLNNLWFCTPPFQVIEAPSE